MEKQLEIDNFILEVLRLKFPDIDKFIVSRDPNLIIEWPSQNPRVPEPLRLSTDGCPNLHWHLGYFYDFVTCMPNEVSEKDRLRASVIEIADFLDSFFCEKIGCGLEVVNGVVHGGGPVWFDQQMFPDQDVTEVEFWASQPNRMIRSYKGNRDLN